MPVYTYHCDNCGVEFDRHQKFSDTPLTRCPECGKKTLHKVYGPVGVVFKGSGFYATDHRSPSGMTAKTDAREEKTTSAEKTPSTEKSAETKPSETKAVAEKTTTTPTKDPTSGKE